MVFFIVGEGYQGKLWRRAHDLYEMVIVLDRLGFFDHLDRLLFGLTSCRRVGEGDTPLALRRLVPCDIVIVMASLRLEQGLMEIVDRCKILLAVVFVLKDD